MRAQQPAPAALATSNFGLSSHLGHQNMALNMNRASAIGSENSENAVLRILPTQIEVVVAGYFPYASRAAREKAIFNLLSTLALDNGRNMPRHFDSL